MLPKVINVFFAYASDSYDLLAAAKREIDIINQSNNGDFYFSIREWKSCTVGGLGNPEQCILEQMPIKDCEYFVWVFRFKFGRPTGNKDPITGQEYRSGMEEEFYTAYRYWKEYKNIKVLIFKSEEPVPRDLASDYNDSKVVENFFEDFSPKGTHPGLYKGFKSVSEFGEQFRQGILTHTFSDLKKKFEAAKSFSTIYFDGENVERNRAKQKDMESTSTLRLQANSGFSFLVPRTAHSALLRKGLDRGMRVKIIIPNPWSANAVRTLLRKADFKRAQDYQKYLNGQLDVETLMNVYCNSQWRRERLMPCIQNYLELRKKYGSKIELHLSEKDLSNSILLTDQHLFFEPFFNTPEMDKRDISIFEVQLPVESTLYKDTSVYFEDLWKASYTYNFYKKNEATFKKRLQIYFERK